MERGVAQAACTLFLAQTGESYTHEAGSLTGPNVDGNLMLLEHGRRKPLPTSDRSASRPALDDAFQDVEQRVGLRRGRRPARSRPGQPSLGLALQAGRNEGLTGVRLEVRADNQAAIRFYERRGLTVEGQLHEYYTDGLGLLMRGPMPAAPREG